MGAKLGLGGSVALALGGMIGGGIYAVLGVVAVTTGRAAWAAFLVAGVVAACAGYAYLRLNERVGHPGGVVVFLQEFVDAPTAAGMTGWTLLFGYVGSMAMYAFAFGSYFVALTGVGPVVVPLPGVTVADGVVPAPVPTVEPTAVVRPLVSVGVVGLFVGLNALGVRETGAVEKVLVTVKVGILVGFAALGLHAGMRNRGLALGLDGVVGAGPLMGAAAAFVAFQGWQLLFYDQGSMADPRRTLPRAIWLAIPVAVSVYVAVAVVTMTFAPELATEHPETALAVAADAFLGPLGRGVIAASAMVSTASAINATLFSSSLLARRLVEDEFLPPRIGAGDDADGAPPVAAVLLLGGATAGFAAIGSLRGITSFASLSFIFVFGTACALAVGRHRDLAGTVVVPAVGLVGAAVFYPLLFYRLYRHEPAVFEAVVLISGAVLAAELFYFERSGLFARVRESLTR